MIDDRPFRFVGANLAVMHHPENRAGAEALLLEAARDGIGVARIWAFGEGAADARPWQRENFLFRAGPDGWIEAGPEHLDRVVTAAGRAGIRLIVTLSNSWPDYGGVPQYLRWASPARGKNKKDASSDRFYRDPGARAAFGAHVERLLGRTNRLTGVPYRDDPTIMAWELMNESQVATPAGVAWRRAWIVEMAAVIHRLDPNHLVSAGVSLYRLERERREWTEVCGLAGIDFCDGHLYPEQALGDRDPGALERFVDDFVALAQVKVGKPLVLGEFGVAGDAAGIWQGLPRATWIRRVFDRLAWGGAAGGLLWIYQPAGASAGGGHGITLGVPAAEEVRRVVREASAALAAAPADDENADIVRIAGEPSPLFVEVRGKVAVIPLADLVAATPGGAPGRWRLDVTWDPTGFDRARWEASGVWSGGEIEHAWGAESGWFEYRYDVRPTGVEGVPRRLRLRARLSSEYPGTDAPPGGTSAFQVTLDDLPLGAALAPRDDGRGRWMTLRSSDPALLRAAVQPGSHRIRFTVPEGERGHGLCLYGRPGRGAGAAPAAAAPGKKGAPRKQAPPGPADQGGPVELVIDGAAPPGQATVVKAGR